ncbi:MAG: hypothetical protein QM820_54800 [Minicystis sp.]
MRLRLVASLAALVVVAASGIWFLARRTAAREREHAAALLRTVQEPGVLVLDPALPSGVVDVDLIAVAPDLALSKPATIRLGEQTHPWADGGRVRFKGLAGKRALRVSVAGDYLVEGASFDVPAEPGGRVSLRAIPIDPPVVGPPLEKQLEIQLDAAGGAVLWWKQGDITISDREIPRGALATAVREEWTQKGFHKDPADPIRDRAILRVGPGASFQAVLPVVQAVLATTRPRIVGGDSRVAPAFVVSVQPPLPAAPARPALDLVVPR